MVSSGAPVPPDLIDFTVAAGLSALAYGPDLQGVLDAHRNFWTHFFRNFWKVRELIRLRREVVEPFVKCWKEIISTLTALADGADVLFTGVNFEDAAGNVAEFYDIPLATLHFFPLRANGKALIEGSAVGFIKMIADAEKIDLVTAFPQIALWLPEYVYGK